MSNRPRVFVVHEPFASTGGGDMRPKFDLTPAAEYGDIEVLVPATWSLLSPLPAVSRMREALADFNDDDFLLPVGDPALIMAAGAIAADANGGRFSLLKWDRHVRRYIPVTVDIYGKERKYVSEE